MTDQQKPRRPGPLDEVAWPAELPAHVMAPGPPVRLHGYAAEDDLGRHYGATEIGYLALTGRLPSEAEAQSYDLALRFLATLPLTEGPTHAAVLARLSGTPHAGVLSVAAVALAERARALVLGHEAWLAWLAAGTGTPPDGFAAAPAEPGGEGEDARSVARLAALLPDGFARAALARGPTRTAALLAVLHASGLREPWQLEHTLATAPLAAVVAEAMRVPPGAFRAYSMQIPPFRYTPEEP
ncbi:MAG: hypothetical protein IT373_16445 [Polyangiaceae bacterium]|nr:hypothetical protein [Polyangiaceae bacterium]